MCIGVRLCDCVRVSLTVSTRVNVRVRARARERPHACVNLSERMCVRRARVCARPQKRRGHD